MGAQTYEQVRDEVLRRQAEGTLRSVPTREERIDWAYGNAVLSNGEVTIEAVEKALDATAEQRRHVATCLTT